MELFVFHYNCGGQLRFVRDFDLVRHFNCAGQGDEFLFVGDGELAVVIVEVHCQRRAGLRLRDQLDGLRGGDGEGAADGHHDDVSVLDCGQLFFVGHVAEVAQMHQLEARFGVKGRVGYLD